jgi:hypothetical protein
LLGAGLDLSLQIGGLGESLPRPRVTALVLHAAARASVPAGTLANRDGGAGHPAPSVGSVNVPGATAADGRETPAGLHAPVLTSPGGIMPQRPGDVGTKANSNTNFYGGDFDYRAAFSDENGTAVTDAKTYDDIRFRGGWSNDCVFGRYLMNTTATAMNLTIIGPGEARADMPNGGLPLAFSKAGIPLTSVVPTGDSGFGLTEYQVTACGLLALGIPSLTGHYYMSVQVVGNGSGQAFISMTSGANGKGSPLHNSDSWFSSTYFGYVFAPISEFQGPGIWDFSQGLCIKTACP